MNKKQTHKRILSGIVVSTKMPNTIVVKVTTKKSHPIYKKVIKSWKKYMAETKGQTVAEGDMVNIEESRQFSKNKKWTLVK